MPEGETGQNCQHRPAGRTAPCSSGQSRAIAAYRCHAPMQRVAVVDLRTRASSQVSTEEAIELLRPAAIVSLAASSHCAAEAPQHGRESG